MRTRAELLSLASSSERARSLKGFSRSTIEEPLAKVYRLDRQVAGSPPEAGSSPRARTSNGRRQYRSRLAPRAFPSSRYERVDDVTLAVCGRRTAKVDIGHVRITTSSNVECFSKLRSILIAPSGGLERVNPRTKAGARERAR